MTPSTLDYVYALIAAMPAADAELLRAIHHEPDPARGVRLLAEYYHDCDRAERTPRDLMYFHLGMLISLAGRCLATLAHLQQPLPPDTPTH